MSVTKISVSLSESLAAFVEEYRRKQGVKRSQVFEVALRLLRSQQLEAAYREAAAESDAAWEATVSDGISHETW